MFFRTYLVRFKLQKDGGGSAIFTTFISTFIFGKTIVYKAEDYLEYVIENNEGYSSGIIEAIYPV